jgi:hypothetical protein
LRPQRKEGLSQDLIDAPGSRRLQRRRHFPVTDPSAEPVMQIKRVLVPERLRKAPRQFSWVDQRLVREGYLERCDTVALALYLLLVTVADAQGLSYYGDITIRRLLAMQPEQLEQARRDLIGVGLIAYERPLYQVLALDPPPPPRQSGLQPLQHSLKRWRDRLEQAPSQAPVPSTPHSPRSHRT